MSWFETVGSEVRHQGMLATVRVDRVRTPDGGEVEREIVEHGHAVAIVPVLDDRSLLLLRQYRQPLGRTLVEVPAGKLDIEGEAVEAAARRELIEEVAHDAQRLTHLVTFHNSAGWTTEETHVYLATGLVPTPAPDDFVAHAEEADMEVVRLPLDEAVGLARTGGLTDAKTVIGVLLAAARLELT